MNDLMPLDTCRCKDCKKAKCQGLILGSRLLRHLGDKAYHVSAYVRYQRGRRSDSE